MVLAVATLGWGVVALPFWLFDSTPFRLVIRDQLGEPVSGVTVSLGDRALVTDAFGAVTLEWRRRPFDLALTAPGYHPGGLTVAARPDGELAAQIDERILTGTVVDLGGELLPGAVVDLAGQVTESNESGSFTLRQVEPGTVTASRPAWAASTVDWQGDAQPVSLALEPRVVRAIHITGPAAADQELWTSFLDLAAETELNGLMVDLKDETGRVFFETAVPMAVELGAVAPGYDLPELLADAEAAGLYVIGRVVAFQDPKVPERRPELSVWDSATGAPYENHEQYFLDPTDPEARRYALDLAEEACRAGVDELQFDYVRFPDGFPPSARFDGGSAEEVRIATIAGFLNEAVSRLRPFGCAVAADVFGFTASIDNDGGIGQQWEVLTSVVDVVSPMLYPSHYYPGWFDFAKPNDHPGPVVSRALDDGLGRLTTPVVVRPWLQDFWYDAEQVRAQIGEAEERGLGWMLWNAASRFTVAALGPAE